MGEPFKNFIHAGTVADAARHLQRVWPGFARERFESLALDGLESLELKARAMQLCSAFEATLPSDFDRAAALIEASLAPPRDDAAAPPAGGGDDGLSGWVLWSLGEYVARRGLATPQRALATLHALTQRFSAEFAIRPFIAAHPALVFETLRAWTHDPSAQVRRLVSEGSRPRLPWGMQLKALVADPSPTLPLLAALQDDPSADVRRSVANHLNDIAKDHPGLVADWLDAHLPGADARRRALLRHASRTLIKLGHPRVLAAWGLDRALQGEARLSLAPRRVRLGESFTIVLTLRSTSTRAQKLAIDYAVHHVKADGRSTPKVFKGWVIELAPGDRRVLERRHSMRVVTTRRYHPGRHTVDVRINGRVLGHATFVLLA